jgi:hypothetical protein
MSFYEANDVYSATLTSGYTVGQTTLAVTVVPDNVPTLVTVALGTVKETVFIVTGKTTNSLTGVSRLKGYNGDLDAQMPVTCVNNEEFINQYKAAVSTPASLIPLIYAADGGSTDAYTISLDVVPTEYTAGMMIAFKANTTNTGACTLNVNSLGAKAIKVDHDVDPATGDIQADQIVLVIYDGTNFQLQTDVPAAAVEVTPTSTNTLTNKRIEPRIVTAASYTTDTGTSLSVATADQFQVTAQAGDLKFNNPGGTPVAGQKLIIRIKDNGTARALTYDTQFRALGSSLPSTTVISKTLYMGFIFNATDTKWDLVAVAQE